MRRLLNVDNEQIRSEIPFADLVRPIGGVVEYVTTIDTHFRAPRMITGFASLGNLSMLFPHISSSGSSDESIIGGAGTDFENPQLAWLRAVAEAAERYSTMVHDPSDFVVSSAHDLGDSAMDLSTIPRLSSAEYQDPSCPFTEPNPNASIRWTRSLSLLDGQEKFVPSVMTHLYLDSRPEEAFWQPISTGVAAHTTFEGALVSGICELIERDALAITWLCRLPLVELDLSTAVTDDLAEANRRLQTSNVTHRCFDATTDFGVPTVYAVHLIEGSDKLAQVVSCATDFEFEAACAKTIREAGSSAAALSDSLMLPPSDVRDFVKLSDGAIEMGKRSNRSEFAFLLNSEKRKAIPTGQSSVPNDAESKLSFLLQRLSDLDMDVFAVDLTTSEVRRAGLVVVRLVIPQLQPFTSIYRARFLGNRRLYEYPESAGFGSRVEADINPSPQPFA